VNDLVPVSDELAGHLAALDRAQSEIEQARSIDEVKDIRDRAEAARQYARAAGYSREITNACAEIKIRAERRAGELLKEVEFSKGAATPSHDVTPLPTHDDLGVSRMQSSRWQKVSEIPEDVLDAYFEGVREAREDITTAGLRKFAARQRQPGSVPEPVPAPDGRYQCIVIDPPWPMQKIEREERPNQGVQLDYPVMPVECQRPHHSGDEHLDGAPCFRFLCDCPEPCGDPEHPNEPCRSIECVVGNVVETVALDNCHIYLWVTHKYLPAGLDLLKAWGFNYQCVMTWRKNVGITPFSWMYDTEHVLFGRRGDLKLQRLGLRLSFEAPVQGHSVKPGVFYDRVIAASPGPRVEMFSRRERDGFTAWGNEVADAVV
jgi:N6-adenosine-specific RNA methylase IME4